MHIYTKINIESFKLGLLISVLLSLMKIRKLKKKSSIAHKNFFFFYDHFYKIVDQIDDYYNCISR